MQASDREEFKTEMGKLCASFNVPLTKSREEGYWAALTRMSILQFRKCVEFAIGPDYDGDDFPKTGQIWRIHKGPVVKSQGPAKALPADEDHLAYLANRLLWLHVSHRGGLGRAELERCLKFKRELVAQFCGFVREGDEMATTAAFVRWFAGGLNKVSEVLPRTVRNLEQLADEPQHQKPFPATMATELVPAQPELA